MSAGWEVRRLGDVSKVNYGYTEKASFEKIGPRFLRITDIQNNQVNWETVPFCKIEENNLPKYLLGKGDIVFARTGATTGKSFLINDPPKAVFASYLIRLQILNQEELLPEFLYSFFQTKTYWDRIEAGTSGSAQGGFNASKLSGMEIPVPLIEEQRRIVAVLDEALAGVQQATANTERNLANTQELFDAHLQAIFANPKNNWEEKTLGETCLKIQDGAHRSPQKQYSEMADGRFLYITSKNIRNDYLDLSKIAYVDKEFHDSIFSRCNPEFGDVLLTKDGSNTGNVTINTLDEPFSLLSSVCLIKTDRGILLPKFLKFYLQSSSGLSQITGQMTGAAIKRIILKTIKAACIPLPPLDEQHAIVAQLDDLAVETQRLQAIYRQKLAALQELKQSILQQAFSGQLTQSATHLRGASHLPPTPNTQSATHL